MSILGLVLFCLAAAIGLAIAWLKRRFQFPMEQKYLLSLVQVVIVVFCVLELIHTFNPDLKIGSLVIGSSALIVAIIGFAAQPVMTTLISGLMLSLEKPFEIGDRIVVGDAEPGIVEDITLRHTVLRLYDGIRIIIPNGELNSKTVKNLSYHMSDRRGIHMSFSVSYDTDLEKAMEVIRDCVEESPYTLGIKAEGMYEDSGSVYFLEMCDSALILRTTIWVDRQTNTQKAMTDVNLRVVKAFRKHGIEIPYPYFNIVQFEGEKTTPSEIPVAAPTSASARHRRSETVRMLPGENKLEDAVNMTRRFAKRQNMEARDGMQMELLTEEASELMFRLMGRAQRDLWIEGTSRAYRLHVRATARFGGGEEYKKLLELSSTGKNEAVNTINQKILEAIMLGRERLSGKKRGGKDGFEWKLSETEVSQDDIGRSILAKFSDDIRISVTSSCVELIVEKKTREPVVA